MCGILRFGVETTPEITQFLLGNLNIKTVINLICTHRYRITSYNVCYTKLLRAYPLVILLMLIAIPFINLLSSVNQQLTLPGFLAPIEQSMRDSELRIDELTQKMLNVHEISQLMFNILLISVIPAISEELFFRATIRNNFV